MIGIVIVAHEGLADEYKAALEHVVGQQEQLITVGISENHNRKSKELEICNASDNVDTGFGLICRIWWPDGARQAGARKHFFFVILLLT